MVKKGENFVIVIEFNDFIDVDKVVRLVKCMYIMLEVIYSLLIEVIFVFFVIGLFFV